MKTLLTGSSGHLGEALVHALRAQGIEVVGADIAPSPTSALVGSVADRAFVREAMRGIDTVIHAATLHKPHVATHSMQDFIDTNVTGTLNLLEEAIAAGTSRFVFTSTTSVFGDALVPPPGEPAAWITEDVAPVPKNIYGVTKFAAENLCTLFNRKHGLPILILRTARFFPEEDDSPDMRARYSGENAKANEFLARRVDIADAVSAHLAAVDRAETIKFGKYIISATTPFIEEDMAELRTDAPQVLKRRVPEYETEYERQGWSMFPGFDRVYINAKARAELNWAPIHDFARVITRLSNDQPVLSPLAYEIGVKGYHSEEFTDGPYPV